MILGFQSDFLIFLITLRCP